VTLLGVDFIDAMTGWAAGGEGTIIHTTDGGTTWTAQTSNTTEGLDGVEFVDAMTGWIVGQDGTILHTTDGGTTWTAQTSNTTQDLNRMHFLDATTGWIVGETGTILHTTDGGTTWTAQTSNTSLRLSDIAFGDANNGWIVGFNGTLLYTTDGGANWNTSTSVDNFFYSTSVQPGTTTTGWATGFGGKIYKTTDGGLNWTLQADLPTIRDNAIEFLDANNGFVAGYNGIAFTTDGGDTWERMCRPNTDFLWGMHVESTTEFWGVGSNGNILTYEPCNMTSLTVTNLSDFTDCNADGTFTADVTVNFTSPRTTGNLILTKDASASIPASSLPSGATSYTFTGVSMSANGGTIDIQATFSDCPCCTVTNAVAGTAAPLIDCTPMIPGPGLSFPNNRTSLNSTSAPMTQTFTSTYTGTIDRIELTAYSESAQNVSLTIDGATVSTLSVPASPFADSQTFFDPQTFVFPLSTPLAVTAGTTYTLGIAATGTPNTGDFNLYFDSNNPYAGGKSDQSDDWDFDFLIVGSNPITFSYPSPSFCVDDSDPTPTITGATGGAFSSTTGLSITASTGVIDVSASTPGNYTVTYSTGGACDCTETESVTITGKENATFSYTATSFCTSDTDATPTITGATGGAFSSTTGLSITASTGVIDVSASTPGNYTVTYTTAGSCSGSSTNSVTIESCAPTLTIAAPTQAEEDATDGLFTVTTDMQFTTLTTVKVSITGTAANGTDYTTIPTTFTFPANSNTATIPVEVMTDTDIEGAETVIVTLEPEATTGTSISASSSYIVGTPSFATVTITDNDFPELTIAATTQAEEDATDGLFTVTTNSQFTTATTVNVSISGTATNGTDYTTIPTTFTFPANSSTATIPVEVIADTNIEGVETVIVTLESETIVVLVPTLGATSATPSYTVGTPNSATVTITDNDFPPPTVLTIGRPTDKGGTPLTFSDPCSCTDAANCDDAAGTGNFYFHDVLRIPGGTGTTTAGLDIRFNSGVDFFIDVPCRGGLSLPSFGAAGTRIPETSPGVYEIDFWRLSGVAPTNVVVLESGATTMVPAAVFQPVCNEADCAVVAVEPIPTMSEWGLLIFGLLILNLGVVFVQRKELV